jgi:hypothetical protein
MIKNETLKYTAGNLKAVRRLNFSVCDLCKNWAGEIAASKRILGVFARSFLCRDTYKLASIVGTTFA